MACLREGLTQSWGGFWVVQAVEDRARYYIDSDLFDGCAYKTYKQYFEVNIWRVV